MYSPVAFAIRYMGPVWLVLFLALTIFANGYMLCYEEMIKAPARHIGFGVGSSQFSNSQFSSGIALLIIGTLLKVLWLGPWVQMLVVSWFCDRQWRPTWPPSRHLIRHAAGSRFSSVDHVRSVSRTRFYFQPNIIRQSPDMYLYILLFLPMDCLFSVIVSIFAMAKHVNLTWPFASCLVLATIVTFCADIPFSRRKFVQLAVRNRIDIDHGSWRLAFKHRDGGYLLHEFRDNPWDLGSARNLVEAFGRWYQWPFFFWCPERVYRYGSYSDGAQALPFAEHVWRKRDDLLMLNTPPPPAQRQQQHPFTGVTVDSGLSPPIQAVELHDLPPQRNRLSRREMRLQHSSIQYSSEASGTQPEASGSNVRRRAGATSSSQG